MPALEYFVQHEGRRSPFVQWHDDAVAEPSHEITQPKEKGEFTVALQTAGEMKLEVIREVRFLTGLGLKEAKDLIESAPKIVKEGVGRNEAEKIKATLEKMGLRSKSSVLRAFQILAALDVLVTKSVNFVAKVPDNADL